jgi:hypothetical protein
MKITKRQLRRIIREEKRKVLSESRQGGLGIGFANYSPNSHPNFEKFYGKGAQVVGLDYRQSTIAEASRESAEGAILAELSMIMDSISDIASGMYGLVDPLGEDPGGGDEMAGDLELQVERLNDLYTQAQRHFESQDSESAPAGEREYITLRDPENRPIK